MISRLALPSVLLFRRLASPAFRNQSLRLKLPERKSWSTQTHASTSAIATCKVQATADFELKNTTPSFATAATTLGPTHNEKSEARFTVGLLFFLALLFFFYHGPYRAIRLSQPRDFALIYAEARCWMKGNNPYDEAELSKEFLTQANGPRALVPEKRSHPSVYPPTVLPLLAAFAWLPWANANLLWCLVSTSLFAISLLLTFRATGLSTKHNWLLASALIVFSPTHTGIAMGNPSVLVCSLIAVAIYLALAEHVVISGILLGIAHCFKPQLTICALAVFVTWKCWLPALISLVVPLVAVVASVVRASSLGQYWQWCAMLRQNIIGSFGVEAVNDPGAGHQSSYVLLNTQTVVGLFTRNVRLDDAIAWIIAGAMVLVYFRLRTRTPGDVRWRDLGFFSAITIISAYHRYYDAQILLLLVPFLLKNWHLHRAIVISLCACLLLIAFPSQSGLALWLGSGNPSSLSGVILFRHQPLAVLAIGLLLIPWTATRTRRQNTRNPIRLAITGKHQQQNAA